MKPLSTRERLDKIKKFTIHSIQDWEWLVEQVEKAENKVELVDKEKTGTITVRWQYEDQLEFDMTTEMYRASDVIDGVRMYPFIVTDEGKFYLEVKP